MQGQEVIVAMTNLAGKKYLTWQSCEIYMYTNMYYNNIIIQAHTSAQRMITETYKVVLWPAKEATIRRKTTNTAKMNTHTHTHTHTHMHTHPGCPYMEVHTFSLGFVGYMATLHANKLASYDTC